MLLIIACGILIAMLLLAKIMPHIQKCIKRKALLKKYTLTREKMEFDIFVHNMCKDDKNYLERHRHLRFCEMRCYQRLKKL